MDTGLQPEQLLQQQNLESQLSQLQAQLAYFQGWAGKLAAAQYSRSLSMPVVLAAVQILVCGFPEGTTEVGSCYIVPAMPGQTPLGVVHRFLAAAALGGPAIGTRSCARAAPQYHFQTLQPSIALWCVHVCVSLSLCSAAD